MSDGQWLNRPLEEIAPLYLDHLAKCAAATWGVISELWTRLHQLLQSSQHVWGYVSDEWLAYCTNTWGPQTHHIQLRAAIVLRQITANGLHVDLARKAALKDGLESRLAELRTTLCEYGLQPDGHGANQSLQATLLRLEQRQPEMHLPRTAKNEFQTSQAALQEFAGVCPFVGVLLEYRNMQMLLSSFVNKVTRRSLHPSFDVLGTTGRTSSFGEINAQGIPKDDRIRSCFVPSPGHIFIDADYKTVEMATLAYACIRQFGFRSEMAHAINEGGDLQTIVAATVLGKAEHEITTSERNMAKPINFGKPAGMGDTALKRYAKDSFKVEYTDEQIHAFSNGWFNAFPEMERFLDDNQPLKFAQFFGLTEASRREHRRKSQELGHYWCPDQLLQHCPILGMMCIKILGNPRDGITYPDSDIDYLWSQVEAKMPGLPVALHEAIRQRRPSRQLQNDVKSLIDLASVFTLTGRLRAAADYCARHNTIFQGLAADGAKLALWLLWRAGYRIVNFVHDQVLIEVPADSDLDHHASEIRRLMIEGMKTVVPDMAIEVSLATTDRWH